MNAETYEDLKKTNNLDKIKVYANFALNKKYFPTFEYITREDLESIYKNKDKFKNCIFLIDEMHIFLDARKFMDKGNQKIGYFIGQMGKRGNVFRGNTHFPNLIDFRARAYCERWIYIRKGLLVKKNLWKPILNNNRELSKEEQDMLYIQAQPVLRKLIDYSFFHIKDKRFYIQAKKYFDFYDTEEMIIVDEITEDDTII